MKADGRDPRVAARDAPPEETTMTQPIPLTEPEATEILQALSVSDHECLTNPELVRSIAQKLFTAYPKALTNCDWMLTTGKTYD